MTEETKPAGQDLQLVEKLREGYDTIRAELGKVIVGQEEVVEQLLTALFAKGHCLLYLHHYQV